MKKLFTGMFIGIFISLLAFNFTSYAETSNSVIKLIVNGVTLQDDLQPISFENHVYVPAKSLAESLGASVSWNQEQNSVIITSGVENKTSNITSSTIVNPTPLVSIENTEDITKTTFNGMKAIMKNNQTYFSLAEYTEKIRANNPNNLKEIITRDLNNSINININGENINIPISQESGIIYDNHTYINIKYYVKY